MSSKHDPLEETDMRGFRINLDVMRQIREYASRSGMPKSVVSILDWGCGRGRSPCCAKKAMMPMASISISSSKNHSGYLSQAASLSTAFQGRAG